MYVAPFYEAHRRKNKYFYGIKYGKLRGGGSWAIEILVPGRRTIHSTNRRLHEEDEATSRSLWTTPNASEAQLSVTAPLHSRRGVIKSQLTETSRCRRWLAADGHSRYGLIAIV